MTPRTRIVSLLAAAYTAAILAVLAFLALGLASERLPWAWQRSSGLLPVLIGAPALLLVFGFVAIYRRAVPPEAPKPPSLRRFFAAFAVSLLAFGLGAVVFSFAHELLPRRWFSRGGDWDFDPLLEMLASGLVFALLGFWPVFRGRRRSAVLPPS